MVNKDEYILFRACSDFKINRAIEYRVLFYSFLPLSGEQLEVIELPVYKHQVNFSTDLAQCSTDYYIYHKLFGYAGEYLEKFRLCQTCCNNCV